MTSSPGYFDGAIRETVPLHISLPLAVDLDAASAAVVDVAWLGEPADGASATGGERQVTTDLELPIRDGSGRGPIRKSALIDIRQSRVTADAVAVDLAWQSASLAPLFPLFSRVLRIARRELTLDGCYAPPLGRLGLVIDANLLQFVARRSAQSFLARFAKYLEGEPSP